MKESVDRTLLSQVQTLASTQFSVFSVGQAAALGISPRALQRAADRGWLVPVRRGVYALAGHPTSGWQPLMAAALAAGPQAVISHAAAAAIHGFYGFLPGAVELTMPRDARLVMHGVTTHRSRDLTPEDILERRGVSVTSPIRTVIDIAATTHEHLLARILDEGAIRRLWIPERIGDRLSELRRCGRRGVSLLDKLLAVRRDEANPDSPLEQRVFRVLKPRVPPFATHYQLTLDGITMILDLAFVEFRIAGEIEGHDVRARLRGTFDRGKVKANLLVAHGWRPVYFTWTMDDETMVRQVTALLPPRIC
ncbi:MAG TPA: type IV toxin-antitoxin system AbiEi family antitoxin domain-containing protein [Acidimicrobiales bacterium]|nr:type IV toxin-antitoxin system AbiEi family antitoxin domain-containing protein [Acidimicrobiales bacterium]